MTFFTFDGTSFTSLKPALGSSISMQLFKVFKRVCLPSLTVFSWRPAFPHTQTLAFVIHLRAVLQPPCVLASDSAISVQVYEQIHVITFFLIRMCRQENFRYVCEVMQG